ncbi:hypothetical protein AB0E69_00020 [Kribbella sp. NPDC026611]|uniref:hypothetical protein n=1 Tax=Kribbella sp. NPDC026611 TaxID=3154911 RepID=UPI0033E133CB
MTETELKQRMTAGVAEVEASDDLLDRVRAGGARRVRRRQFIGVTAAAFAVVVGGGAAIAVPAALEHRGEPPVGAKPGADDPYASLMIGPAKGDLAHDKTYLGQVLQAWRSSHRKSVNADRGIFDHMQGDAQVAWAGNTPGGRAAIVVENADLRVHSNVQLYREGIATLIGYVGDSTDGKPVVVGDDYPVPGASQSIGFVVEKSGTKALVVMNLNGQKLGWSAGRSYLADGSVKRIYLPLTFRDRIAVVTLPPGQDLSKLRLSVLPGTEFSELSIVNGDANRPSEIGGTRLWGDDVAAWPMTDGADKLRARANDEFNNAVAAVSDPNAYGVAMSLWTGYGVTANGTAVYLGEQALDADPTHVYAVLKPRTGNVRIAHGGVPDKDAVLPVQVKLPDGQGWAVAQKDAQLSYRLDGGAWSPARSNALLVPAGDDAEVKVEHHDRTDVVTLR